MQKELVQDYLRKSGMPLSQAEALARILEQTATKNDIALLEQRIDALRFEVRADLQTLKADVTWRLIACMGFFAAIMTVLDVFID